MNIKEKSKQMHASWYFLIAVVLLYIIVACIDISIISSSLKFFLSLVFRIAPIFIIILVLMVITNYLITPKLVTKYFRAPGIKKWLFVVVAGILSTGPIYMWYPLLADLREKGVHNGFLATFLYSRAIKIWLLPVVIFYFSLKYVLVLTIVMIVFSLVQGIAVNNILRAKT